MDDELHPIIALYDALEWQPQSVPLHESLLEMWIQYGDEEMAKGVSENLLQIDPNNEAAKGYLKGQNERASKARGPPSTQKSRMPEIKSEEWQSISKTLTQNYSSLKLEAKLLHEELTGFLALSGTPLPDSEMLANVKAIMEGQISKAVPAISPVAVRETARAIQKEPRKSQELILRDFEDFIQWASYQEPPLSTDEVRARLLKRKTLLEAALPERMERDSAAAFAVIEREFLEKKYVNDETMLGDKISDIPKGNFFVSEDNYAWDMDELVQAISAGEGVMRNPLSKKMFSESDIKAIIAHPLGQRLRAMQLKQSELKKGVREATIERVEHLGKVMLETDDVDGAKIREAIEVFEGYVATIPESEQKTIAGLKIEATDRFSRQAFDYTIGESVSDAKANTTCFHKVGDFLTQAAAYLRRQ